MTPKEQISATGAQLYARAKMLDIHLQKKDIQTFKSSAETLQQEALKLVEAYPDYIHGYVVYCHIVSSMSEKYACLQTRDDSAHAVELLALSLEKLTEFVYPDKLKYESAANLSIANAFRLCHALEAFCLEYDKGYKDLYTLAVNILRSLYNKVLAFHPDIAGLKAVREYLQPLLQDVTSSQYALSKDLVVRACGSIHGAMKADVILSRNKKDDLMKDNPDDVANDVLYEKMLRMKPLDILSMYQSNPPASAPAKTASSSVSMPTQTKVEQPRNNTYSSPPSSTTSYSSSYSYKETWWSGFKDMMEALNDKIEDLGKWFYYNVYEAGEIGSNILVGGIIIFSVIGVISAWATEGFGMAILAAFIGYIVCAIFMGIGKFVLELCVEGIMYIFRYIFYNAWTLLASVVGIATIITLSVIASGNISSSYNSSEPQEYVVPVTQTYCCTANTVLNVRSAPNGDAKVIGTIKSGQYIEVYNIVDGYAKFEYGDGYGYANTKYLKIVE